MECPKCSTQIKNKTNLCPNCGSKLNESFKEQTTNNNIEQVNDTQIKHSKKGIGIIIAVALLLVIGLTIYGGTKFLKSFIKDNKSIIDNKIVDEKSKKNSLEKIEEDYKNGKLNINEYFTQLVYLEYASSNVETKYTSDYKYYIVGSELKTTEILEKYYEQLDQDIVKLYLTNKSMANISLGEEKKGTVQQSKKSATDYKVKLLKNDDDIKKAKNHRLNKVYLSRNEHFLIWYASYGDDAITDEQLKAIANGLENSVNKYEEYFEIKYSYSPYVDNKLFNDDWDNAKEVLKQNNIPTSILKTAMSVYIYDTGSDGTAASYNDEKDATKWINRSLLLDILDEDGIINYPYITINKRSISKSMDSLVQLYNHELFHHMQYLFCKSTSGERCIENITLSEAMANFASSKVSNVSTKNNFLNNWAGIYTINTSTKLTDIEDKIGNKGYALFPYFYSYSIKSNNWAKILMNAHTESSPFTYIQNNTSKQDLIDTINDLAYKTISQDYDNKSLLSSEKIKYKEVLKEKNTYNLEINAGSIDYFEINNKTVLNVLTKNHDYLTIKLYGYKDGIYKELSTSSNELEIDTAFYGKYDKFYLVVTNGNLLESYKYTIKLSNSKNIENSDYVTTFNNYNIEIKMNTKIKGIEVTQYSKGVVDELHQKEYLEFDTTTMGMTLSNKIYYDFNTGYTYMTQPYGGDVWWKEKGTAQLVDLGKILKKLISMENVTKVSDNHYKVKMTKNDIKDLMKSAKSDSYAVKDNIDIDVYTENGYIVKLEYDFTKIVSGFDTFMITINFSNYDNAGDVEIPQVIVKNAKNM